MKTLLALNTDLSALPSTEGQPPEWIELIPTGPTVTGRDGRTWLFDELAQQLVLAAFTERGIDMVIDWEHATEVSAPKGEEAPAAGWIDQLELRDGALWGHVNWTPRAGGQVVAKEYRFVSPVFDYDDTYRRILRMVSVGLTNKPNLVLTALNHEQEPQMAISLALAVALGVDPTATDEQAVAAVTQLKATATARNNEQPSLEKFVPRGDYDQAVSRATNAENALATRKADDHKAVVNAEIDAALKAGKITPATADYHRACCSEQAGLDRFREFVKAAPAIAEPSGLGDAQPPKTSTALNAEQQAACAQLGLNPVEYAKTLKPEA
ncbi:Mu-like prophage I protein [Pseudomonas asplenii]|uniref:Mu-like prophage I protein n=1 Tax=Pseudomonas asplenii TaxID=53407 RepID=A0A0N0E4K2_9PSED|nr:phage protease [Pseudomonas fuscovaginae]KPA91389.1 Mu-like prophage I protein [Pseudomonas fuscovaginae]